VDLLYNIGERRGQSNGSAKSRQVFKRTSKREKFDTRATGRKIRCFTENGFSLGDRNQYAILLFIEPEEPGFLFGYVEGITLGIPFAMVFIGALMTSKYAAGIRSFKKRCLSHKSNKGKQINEMNKKNQ